MAHVDRAFFLHHAYARSRLAFVATLLVCGGHRHMHTNQRVRSLISPPSAHAACLHSRLASRSQLLPFPRSRPSLHACRSFSSVSYAGANNLQDDVSIINQTCPFVADDVGDNFTVARPLKMAESFQGVIGFDGDVDMFSFEGSAGKQLLVSFSLVDDFSPGPSEFFQRANLDAQVALYSGDTGGVLQTFTNDGDGVFSGFFTTSPLPYTVRAVERARACSRRSSGTAPAGSVPRACLRRARPCVMERRATIKCEREPAS